MSMGTTIYLVKDKEITIDYYDQKELDFYENKDNLSNFQYPLKLKIDRDVYLFIELFWNTKEIFKEFNDHAGQAITIKLNKKLITRIYVDWISELIKSPLDFLEKFGSEQESLLTEFRILLNIVNYCDIQIYCCW